MTRLYEGDACPSCGTFLSGAIDHSPYLIEGGIEYVYCKRCGYEQEY